MPWPSIVTVIFGLYMNCALGVMKNADLQAWKQESDVAVTIRTFDALDGVRPTAAPFDAGARSLDGRMWFANSVSLQVVDPERLARNTVPPPVHIEQLVADRKAYAFRDAVRLPPLTRDLQIDYVGLSFVASQKVRFRYRLDGRDDTWQEAGSRRQAFYNDLRPGSVPVPRHRQQQRRRLERARRVPRDLHSTGVVPDTVVPSADHRGSVLAMWVAYRLRIRQVARALNARFDERLAERTRMARDLHDTLLQTLQGSKMVADNALDRRDDAPTLARALEQVSAWLGQASEEGRATVNALRTSTTERNDLAEAFRRAIEDCRTAGRHQRFADSHRGRPGICIRSCAMRSTESATRRFATPTRTRAAVASESASSYGRDLTLRVADDGVGMESTDGRARKGRTLRSARHARTRGPDRRHAIGDQRAWVWAPRSS